MQRPTSRLVRVTSLRTRTLVTTAALCLTLIYLFRSSSHYPHPTLESDALDRFMSSSPSSQQPPPITNSSIDWGSIKHRHPPQQPLTSLPLKNPLPLPRIQHPFKPETPQSARTRQDRRDAVLRVATNSWQAYRKYAWKKDALRPLTAGSRDQLSGWAATLVDSLDTLYIMGLRDEFDEAVAAVAKIDFGQSSTGDVNIFETNIRYLGGLLAAYDLSKRPVLLHKAIELGDLIYAGFNTPNRMPVDSINLAAAKAGTGLTVENQVVSASPGTLTLELTRLSQITGDMKYYDAINNLVTLFHDKQNHTALPGLFPMYISMARKDVTTGTTFTLAGCADSLYEYFPKLHALLSGAEDKLATLTRGFLDAAAKHMLFRPMVPDGDDILIPGNVNVDSEGIPHLDPETEHLACFLGGTFALAGRLLHSEADVKIGARLTRGCVYAYAAFPTGLMPERLNMVACEDATPDGECKWDEALWVEERSRRPEWKAHLPRGFTTAKDPRYILRPEAIESVFYMWRITGDKEWEEAAWAMFVAVAEGTAAGVAYAAVVDVTVDKRAVEREDYMESFWLAETLKYFYLVFSPPDLISLDKYVLNTEAHPFLRP
ncbi:glycoside hydrolase family 47 protein [Podospora appendiculata]|uniref:alpha-1,2-Mannosidase n=1 Tax=Podospora appendiculata TaxID=314037 RepID=A0AAE0X778_9PEZI|nr:glycoside hydrolase family 47 protein [Podospora appendiculata]